MEDEEDTETSILKTHLIRDSPALASPDLLSEVSEMKQDLIKMTAILTTDSSEKSDSMHGGSLEKGVEEVSGEPFEIMEKVKEDLEKVNEILRSGTFEDKVVKESAKAECRPYIKDEEWVLLSDCEIEEAKMMAAFETQEALIKDIRGSRGSQTQKGKDGEPKEYFLDVPVTSGAAAKKSVVQEKFTEVVLRKGGKKIVPTMLKDPKTHVAEVKKPIRRKGPQGQTDECTVSTSKTGSVTERTEKTHRDDGLLHAPSNQKKSPVSPSVEETPIGSIKDKVKALQKKVEEEQRGRKQTGNKPSTGSSEKKSSPVIKEQKTPTTKKTQAPVKSTKNESERLEESMSVRELMRAFQTGQDPSKGKSGLFEHKGSTGPKLTKNIKTKESPPTVSQSQASSVGQDVSLETIKCVDARKRKEQASTEMQEQELSSSLRPEPGNSVQYQEVQRKLATPVTQDLPKDSRVSQLHSRLDALDGSSDSHKIEELAVSPCASLGEGEVHMSSEESDKHEGMAETLDTSPESLSSSPKQPCQNIIGKLSKVEIGTAKDETSTLSSSTDAKTSDDQAPTATHGCFSVKNTVDYPSKSESLSASQGKTVTFIDEKFSVHEDKLLTSSKPPKSRKLKKRGSETIDSFLSDEDPSDGQELSTSADHQATRAATQGYSGLVLPLRHQDSETISPVADESITISHKDSLESSPLMEDNSSHKSPDSIEPSPTKDSPCCDSLESSPLEPKHTMAFPPTVEQPSVTAGYPTSSQAPELPPENLRRLPRDQEGSVDDDSCQQAPQLTSSGKSLISPDSPSSEEVSYELNPKPPEPMILSMFLIPSVIPEDAEGDVLDCVITQRKFTPEEEMFKMAAKIKTFDEMEQDEKDRKGNSKDIFSQTMNVSERVHESIRLIGPESKVETASVDGLGPTEPKQGSQVAQSVEPAIKVQPPSPFSAGVHEIPQTSEDMAHTAASTDDSAMEGPQSVSEKHTAKAPPQKEMQSLTMKELEQKNTHLLGNKTIVNTSPELKEGNQKKSIESNYDDKSGQQIGVSDYQGAYSEAHSQVKCNIRGNIKGDYIKSAGTSDQSLSREGLRNETDSLPSIVGQTRETFKPEICIYDETEDDDLEEELPKTKSRGVTAKTLSDNWNVLREDDDAFAERVKEEEQKILGLAVDQQSKGATPDTTPGRTPTEEGTPTSEQNPFLFQEGKLFEMTRSGAIDMTKRGYEEEGFAYFQIGEQPIEEALVEDIIEETGADLSGAEKEIAVNLTVQIKPEDPTEVLKETTNISLHSTFGDDQSGTASKLDLSQPTILNKLALSVSPKTSEKPIAKEAGEKKTDRLDEDSCFETDLGSSDTVITDVQTAVTTVTRSVYSQQDRESSDSSPEEEHSVIEQPKAREKTSQTSKMISKSKRKAATKGNICSTQKKSSFSKEEEEKPKSRIPIKAISHKSETEHDISVKSPKEKKSKLPVKPETRRKSETDTGPSVSSRVTRSIKAKSFCESDSTKKPPKKDQGRPAGTELPNKYKTLPSKLPVRGKPVQPAHTTTTGKKDQLSERPKKSIDFFEEISDEAAKLVERLAQAEKEKEEAAAMSDDESSTIDVSVIESEPFPDMQMPLPEDPLVIRPRWDDPVETQMERIPADKAQVQSQGIPIIRGPFSLSHLPQHVSNEGAASMSCS